MGKTSERLLRELEEMGEEHIMTSIATPLRDDAFIFLMKKDRVDKRLL